jgi:hydrogenase maturation protease
VQSSMNTRIIGLGNAILTDDGVGIYTVREVARRSVECGFDHQVDIVESEVAGFDLMELMAGWKRVILVDSIQFAGLKPGTVIRIKPDDLHTSLRLRSVHDIDLPTVLELGHRLGLPMPKNLTIFGIQVEDPHTIGECLTQTAALGMKKAVGLILEELSKDNFQSDKFCPPVLPEPDTHGG